MREKSVMFWPHTHHETALCKQSSSVPPIYIYPYIDCSMSCTASTCCPVVDILNWQLFPGRQRQAISQLQFTTKAHYISMVQPVSMIFLLWHSSIGFLMFIFEMKATLLWSILKTCLSNKVGFLSIVIIFVLGYLNAATTYNTYLEVTHNSNVNN